jgi:hypothetical protein
VNSSPLVGFERFLFDPQVMQCIDKGRSIPIPSHRASRPARTAAATVSRFTWTSAPRNRPSIRRGFTSGTGSTSTRRMLPSDWTVASKVALGWNKSELTSLPLSSVVNFILFLSHTKERFSSLLNAPFRQGVQDRILQSRRSHKHLGLDRICNRIYSDEFFVSFVCFCDFLIRFRAPWLSSSAFL